MKNLILFMLLILPLALFSGEPAKAPSFSLRSMENETICLDSLSGNYIIIDFWATYCKSCVGELDALKDIFKTFEERELVFLAINEDGPRNVSKVPGFVKGHQWKVVELRWDISDSHTLNIMAGSEKGGLICSGGVCRIEEPFDGVKIDLLSKF